MGVGNIYDTLQYTATHCNTLQHIDILGEHGFHSRHAAAHCNTLQHLNMLDGQGYHLQITQHTKTLNPKPHSVYITPLFWYVSSQQICWVGKVIIYDTLYHTATHCNILQHAATRCNTLQHTATHCNTLQHTATYCNTLQHTATHCKTQIC